MKKICMVVQDRLVKGGIAAVIDGYYGSQLEKDYNIIYIESYKDGSKLEKLWKAIVGYFRFAKVLYLDKPDLIHVHSSFGPSFYRKIPFIYLASWVKIPIVNHIHGADFNEFYVEASEKKREVIKNVYGKCSKLIALSEEWGERLQQIVNAEKIEIIENYSVIHEEVLPERVSRGSNKRVLFLGELGRRKGCYNIPDVVALVAREIPDVKFVLCGTGNEADEVAIEKLIREKDIEGNVEFPGWVRDEKKDKELREADVFFLPSYNEGMPMSILDAMGYGLPVVSTNVGGIPKIVQDGENGFLCDAGDINSMAKAIQELLLNDDLRLKMGQAGYENIKKEYSLEKHIKELERVYNSLLMEEGK